MTVAELVSRMLEAGATPDVIGIAVQAMVEQPSAGALRTRRWRHKTSQVTLGDAGDTNPIPQAKKAEVSPAPLPSQETQPPSPPIVPPAPKLTPREELAVVLDAEHASAVVEHRQRIGKPMTPRAAHLLARKFAAAPDPNTAADAMIANGWQGFEVEWLESRVRPSTGPPKSGPLGTMLREIAQRHGQNHEPDFDLDLSPIH